MPRLSEADLALPASIGSDGRLISAREFSQTIAVSRFEGLTSKDKKALTLARIRAKPDFNLQVIADGVVSQERALSEVENDTPLGRQLIEIEGRQISVVNRILQKMQAELTENPQVVQNALKR